MIVCDKISLSFSGKVIFDNLNIEITPGENVCISGASGKGKSTLLDLIQGYVRPSSGTIKINGQILNEKTVKQIRNKIISVPQNIHLPVKTGTRLMELMEVSTNISEVRKYMNQLGLEEEIISKDFSKISGGQKQRLIISICLSLKKDIILMDEPTASLDDKSIELLIKTVKTLKGKTIVSASHNKLWVNSTDRIIEL